MARRDIEELAETVTRLVVPGMTPKGLLAAVREAHPEASNGEIVRAAFYALLSQADGDAEKSVQLHAFAISQRHS